MCDLSYDIPFHHGETCEERRASERLAAEEADLKDERSPEEERNQHLAAFDREAEQREREAADIRYGDGLKSSRVASVCHGCNIKIHKIDGCDHMTLCWECLAPYGGPKGIVAIGNSAHQDSCRHASRNLPNGPDDSDSDDY